MTEPSNIATIKEIANPTLCVRCHKKVDTLEESFKIVEGEANSIMCYDCDYLRLEKTEQETLSLLSDISDSDKMEIAFHIISKLLNVELERLCDASDIMLYLNRWNHLLTEQVHRYHNNSPEARWAARQEDDSSEWW